MQSTRKIWPICGWSDCCYVWKLRNLKWFSIFDHCVNSSGHSETLFVSPTARKAWAAIPKWQPDEKVCSNWAPEGHPASKWWTGVFRLGYGVPYVLVGIHYIENVEMWVQQCFWCIAVQCSGHILLKTLAAHIRVMLLVNLSKIFSI